MCKEAVDYPSNIGVQSFIPVLKKRELSENENENIKKSKSRLLPKIFKSYKTPAHELMASPVKQGLLAALAGGTGGGLLGYGLGGKDPRVTAAGALAGSTLAGILQYYSRKQQNENIEDLMSRTPENSTYRDILSDPVEQKKRDRQTSMATAAMMANALISR